MSQAAPADAGPDSADRAETITVPNTLVCVLEVGRSSRANCPNTRHDRPERSSGKVNVSTTRHLLEGRRRMTAIPGSVCARTVRVAVISGVQDRRRWAGDPV